MTNDGRQWPIERFIGGLDELQAVLGADVEPTVARVRAELIGGIAARDRGDGTGALTHIARAMAGLAELGDQLGGAEGAMMRAVTSAFIAGMAHDDREIVERNLKIIQDQAGTPKKE